MDFTNPEVVDWQMANQSTTAARLGYDSMAFDNFGGGARQGANNGQACGVWQRDGTWKQIFPAAPAGDGTLAFAEASVRWIEMAKGYMAKYAPRLGIVPNVCIDRPSPHQVWGNTTEGGDSGSSCGSEAKFSTRLRASASSRASGSSTPCPWTSDVVIRIPGICDDSA